MISWPTPLEQETMIGITQELAREYNMMPSETGIENLRVVDFNEIQPLPSDLPVHVHLRKEFADNLMANGDIKFGTLRSFRESESEHSRDTNEGRVITWIVNSDLTYVDVGAIEDTNHVYCTSLTPQKSGRLRDFGESTIRIKNPYRFFNIVAEHLEMMPVHFGKVSYTPLNAIQLRTGKVLGPPNPLEKPGLDQLKAQIALTFLKRPEFRTEQECRFMWVSRSGKKVESEIHSIPQVIPLLERIH